MIPIDAETEEIEEGDEEPLEDEDESSLLTPAQPAPPSGRIAPGGVFIFLLVGLLTTGVTGVLWFLVTQLIDFLFILSVVAGMLMGVGLAVGVRLGRVRNHVLVTVMAILLGFLAYGVKMACGAYLMRAPFKEVLVKQLVTEHQMSEAEAKQRTEIFLTPARTLTVYAKMAQDEGMTLFTTRYNIGTNRGLTFRGGWFWLLVVLESIVVGIASLFRVEAALAHPFCEKCNRWTKTSRLFRRHPALTEKAIDRVRHQDWEGLQALDPAYVGNNDFYVDVRLQQCPVCEDATIIVKNSAATTPRFMAVLPAETANTLKATLRA